MLHPETTVSENLETQQLPLQQFNNNLKLPTQKFLLLNQIKITSSVYDCTVEDVE